MNKNFIWLQFAREELLSEIRGLVNSDLVYAYFRSTDG